MMMHSSLRGQPASYGTTASAQYSPSRSPVPSMINGPILKCPRQHKAWIQKLPARDLRRMDGDVLREVMEVYEAPPPKWEQLSLEALREECYTGVSDLSKHPKAEAAARLCEPTHITSCSASDGHEIALRVIRPHRGWSNNPIAPVICFYHGGGHCIGGPVECFDYACQILAVESQCVVISVEYRLAPESPFPQGVNDCWEAACYIAENAEAWGGDGLRLCVCGDSAGGNLSAVVANKARDEGTLQIQLQILLCPVVDWHNFDRPSYHECGAAVPACHAEHMEWYQSRYLPRPGDRKDPLASPIYTLSLDGVAPAIVINAEFDPLRSEGEDYAARLAEAGKLLRCTTYPGVMHDFYLRLHYSKSDGFWEQLGNEIREVFGMQ